MTNIINFSGIPAKHKKAYKMIKDKYENNHSLHIICRILSSDFGLDWSHGDIKKALVTMGLILDKEYIEPHNDERYRVYRSTKLWVVDRNSVHQDMNSIQIYKIINSIERTIIAIKGEEGEWVRFRNRYYPLHDKEELSKIISEAKKGTCALLFEKNVRNSGKKDSQLWASPFIYLDEEGVSA